MKFALVVGVLALSATPAFALPSQAPSNQGTSHAPATPNAQGNDNNGNGNGSDNGNSNSAPPSNAKAYGKLCQGESKKHVAGTPGTPFSKCVTDAAKAANGTNPTTACKNESKKHVAGQHGTPFSLCVSAAAKAQQQQQQD